MPTSKRPHKSETDPSDHQPASEAEPQASERIAKRIARSGLCSRREAERWITDGRVTLNGRLLVSPAVTVSSHDTITVDGNPLPEADTTRLWLYHKKRGLVTTNKDPEGRTTVFEVLPDDLPRVMTIGRLDINTEGLLLLTNDGGLARVLELPTTGWSRRYRVRVHGRVNQKDLDQLKHGITLDGIHYGSIEAAVEREQGTNSWLTMVLREGKNREIKNVLGALGLQVTRLIRVSFGPFQLSDLAPGAVSEVKRRVLRDQLGTKLCEDVGLKAAATDTRAGPGPTSPKTSASPPKHNKPMKSRSKPSKSKHSKPRDIGPSETRKVPRADRRRTS